MEKLSERERILLGYASQDPFGSLPDSQHRNSDVDFHDVFGGPPRRSSLFESRWSRADSFDSYSSSRGSGSGERPVFGEVSSLARRRHLREDFFSDIFQSSDSGCSTPRRGDRDPFPSSSPGSRVVSPSRPVPIRGEAVAGGSSLPAQLSLSMKLAKGVDQPAFSSPTLRGLSRNEDGSLDPFSFPSSPNATVSSFTARGIPSQDDVRNDGHALYCQSPLSRQISHNLHSSLEAADSASLSIESKSQKHPTSLKTDVSNGQFHFSIYKWAGKGVTLVMPSKSNERNKNKSRFRRLPDVVLHVSDLPLDTEDISAMTEAPRFQSENQDSKLLKDLFIERKDDANSKIAEDFSPSKFQSDFLNSDVTKRSGTGNDYSEEVLVTMHEAQEHESKNVGQLFDDDLDGQRNEDMIRRVEETEGFSRDQRSVSGDTNVKQHAERENKMKPVEVLSPCMQDSPVPLEDKMLGSKVKGKVREFIRIFNPEVLPKRKGTFETQDRRSKGRDGGKDKVDNASTAKMNQEIGKAQKASFTMSYDVCMIDDSFSDSAPQIFDASVCSLEETPCEDLEVVGLRQDQNKNLQTDSNQEEIKISDAKIREWSKGKEGNIRSLLSTLQYVLWPQSGWKSVPLVDIIEGTSVKRAYQKALLCLHPDKLQQKGAATHQKYIAEMVFKILQEAWDHFNSVTQF